MTRRLEPGALASLGIVYLVWGSTFLAMRIGVRPGSGFPPWWMGASRIAAAMILLLLLVWLRRSRFRFDRRTTWAMLGSGVLIWVGGHGLLLWAEQWAASGYTSLFIAGFPLLAALYDAVLDRRAPTLLLIAALVVGLVGIGFLVRPNLGADATLSPLVMLALLTAPVAWSAGFTIQKRLVRDVSPFALATYQHAAAVPLFVVIALAVGEPRPDPQPDAWLAWGYLVVFGSVIAFSAAVHALDRLPPRIAMTYGYVNPVVAVTLGHLVLNETVDRTTLAGAALVLVGVYGVFRDQRNARRAERLAAPEAIPGAE